MLTEFEIGSICTAVMSSHLETGENFDGAISIGHYNVGGEIWIEAKGMRMNIQAADVDTLCKQLKRAKSMAASTEEPG